MTKNSGRPGRLAARAALCDARNRTPPPPPTYAVKLRTTELSIPAGPVWLDGLLTHAPNVRGLAVMLQPNAASLSESRESYVAGVLQSAGLATLAVNLLTRYEETRDPDARYNVPQMANRVLAVADWIAHQPPLVPLAVGLLANGTACGAAVRAGWKGPERFAALVCRGGRPDLAGATPLAALTVPIRVVVGADDPELPIVKQAFDYLRGPRDWQLVSGAGPLFAEPGTLDGYAQLAAEWLLDRLPAPRPREAPEPSAGIPASPDSA